MTPIRKKPAGKARIEPRSAALKLEVVPLDQREARFSLPLLAFSLLVGVDRYLSRYVLVYSMLKLGKSQQLNFSDGRHNAKL